MNNEKHKRISKLKKHEPLSVKIWKQQIIIYFFRVYQIKKDSKLALMNSDDDYFNIIKTELSISVSEGLVNSKKTKSTLKSNFKKQKIYLEEIAYFLNDIYNENDEIRSIPVKYKYLLTKKNLAY
jgi:hypothetical protein